MNSFHDLFLEGAPAENVRNALKDMRSGGANHEDIENFLIGLLNESASVTACVTRTVRGPFLILDQDLKLLFANTTFYETFGSNPVNAMGKPLFMLNEGQWDFKEFRDLLESVLHATHTVSGARIERDFPGIGLKAFLVNACLIRKAEGTSRVILSMEDITERERRGRELEESEAVLNSMLENIPEGIAMAFADEKITVGFSSRYGQELMGIDPRIQKIGLGELMEKIKFFHPDGVTRTEMEELGIYKAVKKGEVHKDLEWIIEKPDGTRIAILANAGPIRDREGRIIGGVVAWRDITERKRKDDALAYESEILDRIFEIMPVGVFIIEKDGAIVRMNEEVKKIWGGPKFVGIERYGEFKGWWPDTGEEIGAYDWAAARAITKGETSIGERIEIEGFDGIRRYILNSAVPIRIKDEIKGAVVVNEDITELMVVQKEQKKLIGELEEALKKVKVLSGLFPICASCKRIRDDEGKWVGMESYIEARSQAQFTHTICPDCEARLYPEGKE